MHVYNKQQQIMKVATIISVRGAVRRWRLSLRGRACRAGVLTSQVRPHIVPVNSVNIIRNIY